MEPKEPFPLPDEERETEGVLENPISSPKLREIVKPKERVVIMVSDITRPSPSFKLLPPLLKELKAAGMPEGKITIVYGLGIHRRHRLEEQKSLVGEEIYRRFKCIDAKANDYLELGKTSRGTPIQVFRLVAEADRRICTGNIEFHYFAGYSGGAKAIMPGASTRASIQANHSLMVLPNAKAGRNEGNPVREDIEEVGRRVGIDFILNVVLNDKKQIVKAVTGDSLRVHRQGCTYVDALYKRPISSPADIVLVSAGGFPKDINLYQSQKALDNAHQAVKDGGIVILIAECPEGLGERVFEEWALSGQSPDEIIERIKDNFVLGGHKALEKQGGGATIWVMPSGSSTLPSL